LRKIQALLVLVLLLCTVYTGYFATAYLISSYTIQMTGNIYTLNLEAFWDSQCTNRCETIDWGWFHPGDSKSLIIYLRNNGNVNATLSLSTANWIPAEAADYISLTWNREGYLMTEKVIECTLTLTVSTEIQNTTIQSFSFDAIITATET